MISQPPKIKVPTLLRSSKSLGWSDNMVLHKYALPDTIEGWREPTLPDIRITMMLRGTIQMNIQRTEQRSTMVVDTGDLFIIPAEIIPAQLAWTKLSDEAIQTVHLHINQSLFKSSIEELVDRDPNHISLALLPGTDDPLLMNIVLSLQNELENPSSIGKLYMETATQMIIVHLLRHYTTERIPIPVHQNTLSEQQVSWITDYVNAYLTDDLSLSALAGLLNFSTFHFARLFQKTTGESVHKFVLRQRLQRAQQLLVTTDIEISQIALQTGFTDQSHLTHAFRHRFKITPGAYRQSFAL